ncbi:MAG: efflux RND transporter periplasmic adaptor subunit [Planctomycetaceae bacterium]|nr:efflux RND transporter periplasmic adaptor subunit [Planctomycetaceae bacterium]
MNTTTPTGESTKRRHNLVLVVCCITAAVLGAGLMYMTGLGRQPANAPSTRDSDNHEEDAEHDGDMAEEPSVVTLQKEKWEAAGIEIAAATTSNLTKNTWVTGKVTLNQDRVAHIYSLVEGRVHEVDVQFGDSVSQGARIAVIDSREVGAAKLALAQSRLDAEFARVNNEWQQKVSANTLELITALSQGTSISTIEKQFGDRPMGDFRAQLLTSFASLQKSRADFERLQPLSETGAVAGRAALAAKTSLEADQATFDATMEQLKFKASQQSLLSSQKLRQAQQSQAVATSQLFILGYDEASLEKLDPERQGESIAHFDIRAPFDGTVLAKNVVIAQRVGTDTEMFQIADLSSVWIEADIYQKDLPRLQQLGETLHFRAPLLTEIDDGHSHEARIFYKGDVLDEQTRTMRLRAVLDNPDRHLKPGMFVEVQLPGETIDDVLVVPVSAVQTGDDRSFVFVHKAGDEFERRDVSFGATSNGMIQISEGLKPGEKVVIEGGFSLKSELMKGQISHGH